MNAAVYLRKSRMEEGMDTQEVLSRHRQDLDEYAKTHGIHIIKTYSEVVSGESLYARPQMLRLLEDVEEGRYNAILVMDLDRLSRGRMKDQGIILDTFKDTGTLIVTPEKTYDLSDDLDDELAEMKTFMSRREYKMINKRLQRGLKHSIKDGWYVANAPYGYRKITMNRRPTLEIVEDEAHLVRMMYAMYVEGHGCISIARHINSLGAKTRRHNAFGRSSIAKILRNPTYIGKIVWDQKSHVRKGSRGNSKHIVIYNPKEQWTITEGRHPAIVATELFNRAQDVMDGRYIPGKNDGTIKSSLAGLIKCARCGKNMQRMDVHTNAPYLLCTTRGCCAGTKFAFVEAQVLEQLRATLEGLTLQRPAELSKPAMDKADTLAAIRRELAVSAGQKDRLHELLERGEYSLDTFRERMDKVNEKISSLQAHEKETLVAIRSSNCPNLETSKRRIKTILSAYECSDAARRNALLKSVISKILYTKEKKTTPMDFHLELELKSF